jgi:hypothetical protein
MLSICTTLVNERNIILHLQIVTTVFIRLRNRSQKFLAVAWISHVRKGPRLQSVAVVCTYAAIHLQRLEGSYSRLAL